MKSITVHVLLLFFFSILLQENRAQSLVDSMFRSSAFVYHLHKENLREPLMFIHQHKEKFIMSKEILDSLSFYVGLNYYNTGDYILCHQTLQNLSPTNPLYARSIYVDIVSLFESQNYAEADRLLNDIEPTGSIETKFNHKLKLASALYQKDTSTFRKLKKESPTDLDCTALEKANLSLKRNRKKSPLMAGLLSTLLPGSGKVYAGYPGQGLSTLLILSTLGLQAWEGYHLDGFNSPHLYVFGSIFSLFYVGNIHGSVWAVKMKQVEFNQQLQNAIFLDINFSLQRLLE